MLQINSHIWNKNSRNFEMIKSALSSSDCIKSIEDTDLYGIRFESEEVRMRAMQWYDKNGFKGDSPNDVKMEYYLSIIKSLPNIKTVLEIGGGMGKLAQKIINNNISYTGVDIPETLDICKEYLKRNNLNAELISVNDVEILNERQFDLVINTHSFGEMSNNDVKFWIDLIENKIKTRYFVGINRFLNTVNVQDDYGRYRLNENTASILFDNKWKVLDWELNPKVLDCPYEDTRAARCLQIILERTDKNQVEYEDMSLQDWYRYSDSYKIGKNLDRPINIDTTMGGTLFSLWNNLRLKKDKNNINMMISYLNYLSSGSFPFEEVYYYKDLLKGSA